MNENDLGDLVILQHATCYDLYKNCLPPETVDYMRNLRSQIAHAHAHNEHLMAGRRDNQNFFMRNDDGPLFGRRRRERMMGRIGRMHREGVIFELHMQPNAEEPERALELNRQRELELVDHDPFEMFNNEPFDIDAFDNEPAALSDSGKIH